MVRPYNSTNIVTAWKKSRFMLSVISDFHMTDNLSIAVHAFSMPMLTSLSAEEILLPMYVNSSTSFRVLPFKVDVAPFEKFLPKVFLRKRSTTSQILAIRQISEGVRAKDLEVTQLFVSFSEPFDSIHKRKIEQTLLDMIFPKKLRPL